MLNRFRQYEFILRGWDFSSVHLNSLSTNKKCSHQYICSCNSLFDKVRARDVNQTLMFNQHNADVRRIMSELVTLRAGVTVGG